MNKPKVEGGYILLSRRLIKSEIWEKPPIYVKIWVYLLSKASHKGHGNLKRGQCFITIKELQEQCSFMQGFIKQSPSYKQVRDVLDYLRGAYEITDEGQHEGQSKGKMIVTRKVTRGLLVTIVNYELYQEPTSYESQIEGHNEITNEGQYEGISQGTLYNKNDIYKNDYKKTSQKKFSDESLEVEISKYLFYRIRQNDSKAREPNFQTWAKSIDYLIRLDKRDPKEIKQVIDFATSDNFWKSNILSTYKLREKFQTLLLQAKGNNSTGYSKKKGYQEEVDDEERERRKAFIEDKMKKRRSLLREE